MSDNEKLLMLQMLLENIRGDWTDVENRINFAEELADDLKLIPTIKLIEEYKENCADGDKDGRLFRCHYEYGGYMGMEDLHGLEHLIMDKGQQFKKDSCLLSYPEISFKDWDKYKESEKVKEKKMYGLL